MIVTIIDYGVGNLRSVQRSFEALGCQTEVTQDREKIENASILVLPGR